ncbi:MAG TPA: NAD-dependent malic enzyme [Burkholderiaceae bacterium]|nr:NAD-dependent malic enzyme [Burkholderiaceae bacterium]
MANRQEVHSFDALRDPLVNRGTAFTDAERYRLGLAGRLPPRVETIEEQVARVVQTVRAKSDSLERYSYLSAIQNENETLFFRAVRDNLHEFLPLIYTPTVGQACLEWSRLYIRPRGLYLTPEHRGKIADILLRWPQRDVGIIVVTDGGRILGLGDLGANGMGIPVGKLALYTACAGVPPSRCLPVMLDVGTDTKSIREDRFYLGRRVPRLAGEAYDAFVDEFLTAVQQVFPDAILQFEDFNNANAFGLLARYRDRLCCFNDDVQGSGAMALAGLYSSGRLTNRKMAQERILFVGAGEACLGIGAAIVAALQRDGLNLEQARSRCLFIDSKGTVVSARTDLAAHKRVFAQNLAPLPDLVATIDAYHPTVLIGACGRAGVFTRPVLQAMTRSCNMPVVFALSNPTSKAECTAEQAYGWTDGRVIFAAGSPFDPVQIADGTRAPGQANNSYVFPGVGLGILVSGASRVTDAMFLAAAQALADQVTEEDLQIGRIFPPQVRMREVAIAVAAAVAQVAWDSGLAKTSAPKDPRTAVAYAMYEPKYAS